MVAFVVGLVSAAVRTAHAEPSAMASAPERRLVSVQIAGDPRPVAAVLDVLRERASAGGAVETSFEVVPAIDRATVVTPGPPNERQLARIWIDLREPPGKANEGEPITIYVVDGPWERVLVRPVVRQANAEITWEEIGHIVELAVDALRAGESIGVGRAVAREQLLPEAIAKPPEPAPAPPEPEPPIAPPPPPPRMWKLRGGGFYAVSAYGAGPEISSGPGFVLELHERKRKLEYGATLMAEYRFPSTVDRGSAVVRFEGGAIHALASGALALGDHHQLLLGVGGGVELVQASGSSIELDNIRFGGGEVDAIPAARARALRLDDAQRACLRGCRCRRAVSGHALPTVARERAGRSLRAMVRPSVRHDRPRNELTFARVPILFRRLVTLSLRTGDYGEVRCGFGRPARSHP